MCDEHEFSHAVIISLLFAMSLAPHLTRRRLRFNEASGTSSAGVEIVVFKVQSTVAFVLKLQDWIKLGLNINKDIDKDQTGIV